MMLIKLYILYRQKKLQETLMAVHQLEQNMGNLRHWLAQTEYQLCIPVIYEHCTRDEINAQLQQQEVMWKLVLVFFIIIELAYKRLCCLVYYTRIALSPYIQSISTERQTSMDYLS